jgi:hypothetical protein
MTLVSIAILIAASARPIAIERRGDWKWRSPAPRVDFSHDRMQPAHELNGPTFAHEILTAAELIAALAAGRRAKKQLFVSRSSAHVPARSKESNRP